MIVIIMCFVQVLAAVAPADVVLPPIYVPGTWPSRLFDNDCVRVSPSHLHGSGVFAVAPIPPRTFVGEYVGEVLLVRPRDCTYTVRVTVDRDEYVYIDARDCARSNFTRFLNDPGAGCRASCEFRQNDLSVEVWTSRQIMPGDELTVSYMTWHTPVGGSKSKTPRRSTRAPRAPRTQSRSSSPVRSAVPRPRPTPAKTRRAPSRQKQQAEQSLVAAAESRFAEQIRNLQSQLDAANQRADSAFPRRPAPATPARLAVPSARPQELHPDQPSSLPGAGSLAAMVREAVESALREQRGPQQESQRHMHRHEHPHPRLRHDPHHEVHQHSPIYDYAQPPITYSQHGPTPWPPMPPHVPHPVPPPVPHPMPPPYHMPPPMAPPWHRLWHRHRPGCQ